jgi:hypothetical protein
LQRQAVTVFEDPLPYFLCNIRVKKRQALALRIHTRRLQRNLDVTVTVQIGSGPYGAKPNRIRSDN